MAEDIIIGSSRSTRGSDTAGMTRFKLLFWLFQHNHKSVHVRHRPLSPGLFPGIGRQQLTRTARALRLAGLSRSEVHFFAGETAVSLIVVASKRGILG